MLIVSAYFIWNAGRAVDRFRVSEERPRRLSKSSPDSILVSTAERILYANPAGEEMFAVDPTHTLVEREIGGLVDPAEREMMRDRVRQTMEGARMHISAVRMTRLDGRHLCADAAFGEIVWDGGSRPCRSFSGPPRSKEPGRLRVRDREAEDHLPRWADLLAAPSTPSPDVNRSDCRVQSGLVLRRSKESQRRLGW